MIRKAQMGKILKTLRGVDNYLGIIQGEEDPGQRELFIAQARYVVGELIGVFSEELKRDQRGDESTQKDSGE